MTAIWMNPKGDYFIRDNVQSIKGFDARTWSRVGSYTGIAGAHDAEYICNAYLTGMSIPKIASEIGMSPSNVRAVLIACDIRV